MSGDYKNIDSGIRSLVSGVKDNKASGGYSSFNGRFYNKASGYEISVNGRYLNKAEGSASTVIGGEKLYNLISAWLVSPHKIAGVSNSGSVGVKSTSSGDKLSLSVVILKNIVCMHVITKGLF